MSAVVYLAPPPLSPPVPLMRKFLDAEDAWIWWATAEIARSNGDFLDGPCHPDQIIAAAEVSGFTRCEWFVMLQSGIGGAAPNAPIELLVYRSAISKLESVLRARDLIT